MRDNLVGSVRVASAQSLAQAIWIPVLKRLRDAHPLLRVELDTSESFSPLVEEGYELGVRVGRMPDSNLTSRKLGAWRYVLVSSPQWVVDHPEVHSPVDLPEHWLLWNGGGASTQRWRFQRERDHVEVHMDRSALLFDASHVLVESARAGLGVAAMPPFSVARELADGSLVRVLPTWQTAHELGIFGVTPHRTMQPARVHAVLDAVRIRIEELVPAWSDMTG